MNLTNMSITELVELYSDVIKELKARHVLRTNNVIGDLGEFLVIDHFNHHRELPDLSAMPVGTQNINAVGSDGNRYAIKSTSGHVTGVFYGLEPLGSEKADQPLFEYVLICKFDDNCLMEAIYQLDWNGFIKHKKWHSRMKAWNLAISKSLVGDAKVVFSRDNETMKQNDPSDDDDIDTPFVPETITWEKTGKVNHSSIRDAVVPKVEQYLRCSLKKLSPARYESSDKEYVLYVMSASFSEKNQEYWYSIADENLPWLRNYPKAYVAFALGSENAVLLFAYQDFEEMLHHCLHTEEDKNKKKTAHYHISFSVDGENKVYFKQKKPQRDFINVSQSILKR